MSRLWDKGAEMNEKIHQFTVGDDYLLDARLVKHDVEASIAHAGMLAEQGYLSASDFSKVKSALADLARSHADGEWSISAEEEDVHTALENRLVDQIGDAGKRVHLGRSRNDQVLAALRLYLREEVDSICNLIRTLIEALRTVQKNQGDMALAGYTHMQIAMPSSVGLWAGGYLAALKDDALGISRTLARINVNPLGSAAGYGTPGIEVDREFTRRALRFNETQEPVTAVQLSRGKAEAALVFELALLMQDLGKLASDLILFATTEFGQIRMHESITTGSSIMPQKKNPDVFELVRGRSAQLPGLLQEILGITAKLSSGYHRDMQLIKQPLFRAIDTTRDTVEIVVLGIQHVHFVEKDLPDEIHATEKVNELASKGVPFRDAYRTVADELSPPKPRP